MTCLSRVVRDSDCSKASDSSMMSELSSSSCCLSTVTPTLKHTCTKESQSLLIDWEGILTAVFCCGVCGLVGG